MRHCRAAHLQPGAGTARRRAKALRDSAPAIPGPHAPSAALSPLAPPGHDRQIGGMKIAALFFLALLATPGTALAQSAPEAPQLRALQLRLNEQQQQLQQLQTQPATPQQRDTLRRLQLQLNEQQLELQRLQRQERSCRPPARC